MVYRKIYHGLPRSVIQKELKKIKKSSKTGWKKGGFLFKKEKCMQM